MGNPNKTRAIIRFPMLIETEDGAVYAVEREAWDEMTNPFGMVQARLAEIPAHVIQIKEGRAASIDVAN